MAYLKYKEVTKYFDFSKYINEKDLPQYTLDYVYEGENFLGAYKTSRDYGIFTDSKIVLFDNAISINPYKEIFTIPYSSVASCSILYRPSRVELKMDLQSGYPLRLKFVNMGVKDKIRIRLIYSCMCRIVCNQKIPSNVINTLVEDNINVKED